MTFWLALPSWFRKLSNKQCLKSLSLFTVTEYIRINPDHRTALFASSSCLDFSDLFTSLQLNVIMNGLRAENFETSNNLFDAPGTPNSSAHGFGTRQATTGDLF